MLKHLLAVVLAVSCTYGCRSQEAKNTAYPSIEEQRAALAKRLPVKAPRLLDSATIITDLNFLASDTCQGRRPGTVGHQLAMQRIIKRLRHAGVDSFNHSLQQSFKGRGDDESSRGINICGWIKGNKTPEKYIVITAHYDHLGVRNGKTFYGADDNASGVACLLAMADYFSKNPHPCSLIFVALDKEESGLEGAYSFVDHITSVMKKESILLNLNMDMIARSDNNDIYACGVKYTPAFKNLVEIARNKTSVNLLMGHDYGFMRDDWTNQSDHFAFHQAGIPFIYIGVEDHADYHRPTDTPARVNYSSYIENCNMILQLLNAAK